MRTINHSELATILSGLKGATILSLTWKSSDPARFKADKGRITKVSRYSGMVNARYDKKKAKSQGIELDSVEIKPVSWRSRIGKSCLFAHNGNGTRYVEFYPQSGGAEFTLDGTPCQRGDVKDMVKKSAPSNGRVAYFTPKLTGIVAAQIAGESYKVIAD